MLILDTNIWYRISEGTIPKDSFNKSELCLTGMVLLEMMTTERWKFDEKEMMKALETILEINPKYIPHLHYEYLATKILGLDSSKFSQLPYDCIIKSLNKEYDTSLRNLFIETRKKYIEDFAYQYAKRTEEIMNDISITEKLKNLTIFKNLLANDVFLEIENVFNIDRKDINKKHIEKEAAHIDMYLLTRYMYYYKTVFEGIKPQKNDLFDLFNLAYVGLGDFYWTRDKKKWVNRYMTDSMISKFLYKETVEGI